MPLLLRMMPLIEGVGDEVVQFAAVVLVVVVAVLAWWSTNARPDRYRTVLVMRSRTHPITVSIRTRTNVILSSIQNTPGPPTATETTGIRTLEPIEETPRENARVIPLQEMDSIVDADMAMLDNNRLHFYRRIDSPTSSQSATDSASDESESPEEPEPASNAQIREMDSIVSAMEADVTAGCDFFTRANGSNAATPNETTAVKKAGTKEDLSTTAKTDIPDGNAENTSDEAAAISNSEEDNATRILIKLKYLNDTLKEVEGSLDELLKDFKLRHFSTELSSACRVRLIFNGRVLSDEGATLRACGLHHRAVVHCLVHPVRPATQQHGMNEEAGGGATHELITERPQPERAWDLENILMTLVSVALTIVWFFRCEYSNMFTASASVALFGLTVFYSVAIFALYLSDTFQFDRRPAQPQPVPNN